MQYAAEARTGGAAAPGHPDLTSLMASVLDAAPLLVNEDILLQSVKWKDVSSHDVARMLAALQAASVSVPYWLARALLLGGHRLAPSPRPMLTPALIALRALNETAPSNPIHVELLESCLRDVEQAASVDPEELDALVRRLCALGRTSASARLSILHGSEALRTQRAIRRAIEGHLQTLPATRLRLIGTSSTEDLAKHLLPAFGAVGYRAEVEQAAYGTAVAELIRSDAAADIHLLLLLDAPSLTAPDWRLDPDTAASLIEERNEALFAAIDQFARNGGGSLIVNTLPAPAAPAAGFLDRSHSTGAARIVARINARLAEAASRHAGIVLVDADASLAAIPPIVREDPKLWYYGRVAYSARASRALAKGFAFAQRALRAAPCKVLALDLDNTLWGGIVGEDSAGALECGDDFPGNAFKAFQAECLRLKGQGLLLVALSKNEPQALDALADHPGMLLKPDDFVATAVNWQPKSGNLVAIAKDLDLGLDSVLFLDDSPHEREAMRQQCPAVHVPEMPEDVAQRPCWLRGLTETWPVRLTEVDLRRSDIYHAKRRSQDLKRQATSIEDYLAGLQQRLVILPVGPATLARAAQLHLRTNQFNLSMERFDEARLQAMLDDPAHHLVLAGRAIDKFGDHGIVIAATVAIDDDAATILSFLMSCRVIGRQVEDAFLGAILDQLHQCGVRTVDVSYKATPKNGIARDFLERAHFDEVEMSGGMTRWRQRDPDARRAASHFIAVQWSV